MGVPGHRRPRRREGALLLALLLAGCGGAVGGSGYADAPPYLVAVAPGVVLEPLLTVGATVPLTGGAVGAEHLLVGSCEGQGARALAPDRFALFVNHEFAIDVGGPSGPLPSGARVSEFLVEWTGAGPPRVLSGAPAIREVHAFDPATSIHRLQPPFSRRIARFCGAFLAGPDQGFDRPVLLHGEEVETVGAGLTFGGRGGSAFATIDGAARDLPWLGHMSFEAVVPLPGTGNETVLFVLEDAPPHGDGLRCQLLMFVGEKDPASADPLARNGLRPGRLFAFVADDPAVDSEGDLPPRGGSVSGHWLEVDPSGDAAALEAALSALGALRFVRIENGATHPSRPGVLCFAASGAPTVPENPMGRLYRLTVDPADPTAGGVLTTLLDGSEGVTGPDGVALDGAGTLLLLEDPHEPPPGRDSSVWALGLDTGTLVRLAEVNPVPAIAHALAADPGNRAEGSARLPGSWEISGPVDASPLLGPGAWLLAVQAHGLRIRPISRTIEGGQILVLRWSP